MKNRIIFGGYILLFFILQIFTIPAFSQIRLEYTLSMSKPYTHYFEVKMKVEGLQSEPALHRGELTTLAKDHIDFMMPVWAPGSYLVRDFPKNVEFFRAYDKTGKELKFEKTNKYTWRVYSSSSSEVTISYKVYAFEISVRTSFLDESHGYLNGSSIFMYIDKMKDLPATLKITPYKDWTKINTELEPVPGEKWTYHSPNYDILADSPIEIGNQKVFDFNAAGVTHSVVMYGSGNYDVDTLKKYMGKIVEAETKVFGENPNKHYTFFVHNLDNKGGGLEHLNSTTLQADRWTYSPKMNLLRFLGLVAHEYFHLWNVKRIRPLVLGPFDYESENYTTLLWEMEGVTTYYSGLILRRAGIISADDYLRNTGIGISRVENQPGGKIQSAAEASFDAWIKEYKPNENSYNTTISYYSKGSIIGMLLDLEIMNATNGKKNYDDVLKYLYNEYYKKLNRGFTDEEYKNAVEKTAGENLDSFFRKYVYSAEPVDYNKFLNYAGLKLIDDPDSSLFYFGANTNDENGRLIVQSVVEGTAAYKGGLNVNDEIIAVNNFRVSERSLDDILSHFSESTTSWKGENIKVTISREGILQTLEFPLFNTIRHNYKIVRIENPTDKQEMIYKKWLSIE